MHIVTNSPFGISAANSRRGMLEQEHVHRVPHDLLNSVPPDLELADVGAGRLRRLDAGGRILQELDEVAVHARRHRDQVVGRGRAIRFREPRLSVDPVDAGHEPVSDPGALLDRHALQIGVEAVPLQVAAFTGPVSSVQRRDARLLRRALNGDAADVHVHHVGLDAPLHDFGREVDPLSSENLHQRLGNDAAAMVAAGGSTAREETGARRCRLRGRGRSPRPS